MAAFIEREAAVLFLMQVYSCKQTPLLDQKGILYKYADMDVNDWQVHYKRAGLLCMLHVSSVVIRNLRLGISVI